MKNSLQKDPQLGSVAATTTLGFRIVDIITPDDTYPEVLVKYNHGAHSYYSALGV